MAYRLKTFHVQFVAEPAEFPAGSPCRSSEDVERVARAIYKTLDADKEHFLLLAMNNKNRVNGFKVISTGSLTASLVHPREVWRAALHLCAAAVIFVHNHPTGEMLGIRVLDHVVLGDGRFFSFSDRGLM
jgi:DNA repair protein RadC